MTLILTFILAMLSSNGAFADGPAGAGVGGSLGGITSSNFAGKASEKAEEGDKSQRQLEHEGKHWVEEAKEHPEANGEPNHEMMEKAHHDFHEAREMRSQSQEYAKEALEALAGRSQETAQGAGVPTKSDGTPIDIASLQAIAGVPVTGTVGVPPTAAATGSSGFQNPDDLATSGPATAASSDGLIPAPTNNPYTTASATRSYINSATSAVLGSAGGGLGSSGRQFGTSGKPLGADDLNKARGGDSELKNIAIGTPDTDHIVTAADGIKDKNILDANRARVMKQMGLRGPASVSVEETGPIRAKNEDIFNVVHTHYKTLHEKGTFYDGDQPLPETPGTLRNPPTYSRGF